jgi:hypothetical protein
MNYCKECENMIVLHAFSEGVCKLCDGHVSTPHIPCFVICESCSEEFNLCLSCGGKL